METKTYIDRLGRVWPYCNFYDVGSYRLLEEEAKTMSDYFIDDVDGGCWVYYK